MGQHDDCGFFVEQFAKRWHYAFNAGGVSYLAVFDGDIEIKANDNALAGDINIIKGAEGGHDLPYFFAALTAALAVMPKCL